MRQFTITAFLTCTLFSYAGGVFNVMDYGAKGDGKTLDSPAINAAIEAAVKGTNYPEPKFAGQTPAHGLYARHVVGLEADNLTFSYERPEFRPAVVLDDVRDSKIGDINAPTERGIDKIVMFNCDNVEL